MNFSSNGVSALLFDLNGTIIRVHGFDFVDGFCAFHDHIKRRGLKTALVTNTPVHLMESYIPKLGLDKLFGLHLYTSHVVNYVLKPDPALYIYAMKQLNVMPNQCIIFEDSVDGIEAARRAEVRTIVGVNSHNNLHELGNADVIIANYHELTDRKNDGNVNFLIESKK